MTLFLSFMVSIFFFFLGCESKEPKKDEFKLVEWLKIGGTCYEDHVRQSFKYEGSLVHWLNLTKKEDDVYGSVHNFEIAKAENVAERVKHPYKYSPPFIIVFRDISLAQVDGKTMTLKGISEHLSENEQGDGPRYESTCEVTVLKRRDSIPKGDE